ncbi:MAG: hypothetical protein ACPGOV_03845 [Magnetovibrionaceae bacterium]
MVINKQMGMTRGDFDRLIPLALGTEVFEKLPDGVRLGDAQRSLTITLGPEGKRKIALLELPSTPVTITFKGYTEEEAEAALAEFDRAFQRGGG